VCGEDMIDLIDQGGETFVPTLGPATVARALPATRLRGVRMLDAGRPIACAAAARSGSGQPARLRRVAAGELVAASGEQRGSDRHLLPEAERHELHAAGVLGLAREPLPSPPGTTMQATQPS
jgi:hypothetical protein